VTKKVCVELKINCLIVQLKTTEYCHEKTDQPNSGVTGRRDDVVVIVLQTQHWAGVTFQHLLALQCLPIPDLLHPSTLHVTTDRHLFNGRFSTTTTVSWHQKGSTIVDFNETRDDRVVVTSAESYANYLHLTPDR